MTVGTLHWYSSISSTPAFASASPASTSAVAGAGGKKVLSKNPNGTYRFQGGGSSRPRNRYQSPVFGRPQAQASKIVIAPEKPKGDSKRRRTNLAQPEASTSTAQQSAASVNGSQPAANGVTADSSSMNLNGSSTPSSSAEHKSSGPATSNSATRARTSGFSKPTAPAVPSPLRQAWGQSDSPPQSSRQAGTNKSPVRQTRAASTLTEILKEVTPPKKPEFVNPYEAATPIPLRTNAKKVGARKTRAAAKAAATVHGKEKQAEKLEQKPEQKLTAQEIIQATVPKVRGCVSRCQ